MIERGEVEDDVFTTPYAGLDPLARLGPPPGRTRAPARAVRRSSRRSSAASSASSRCTRASRRSRRGPRAEEARCGAGATRRPGRGRALRRPPGAARLPARQLRRALLRHASPRTSSSSASTFLPTSSTTISSCSTSSTSAEAATRSTPRSRTAIGPRGQGALRRHVPQAARA